MKNATRNLLLAACVLFSASFDSWATGIKYEQRELKSRNFEIYDCGGYDSIDGWELLGFLTFALGAASCVAAFMIYHRRELQEVVVLSIIPRE